MLLVLTCIPELKFGATEVFEEIQVVDNTSIYNTGISLNNLTSRDTYSGNPYLSDGEVSQVWRAERRLLSGKIMNKLVRTYNGNIGVGTNVKILHWNGGAKQWKNKLLEIESLLVEMDPDLCFVSEANLWENTEAIDKEIPGYKLIVPNTMTSLGHARLVLVVKQDIDVQIITDKIEKEAAMIWVKIGRNRNNKTLIGGIYRQHQLLGMADENLTRKQLLQRQEIRWSRIVRRWRTLSRGTKCVVLGDLNLDYFKWSMPDQALEKMVDEMKDQIETAGFLQLITSHTRTWRLQADSLLDQVWSNCPERTVKIFNVSCGSSDHNVIGLEIALKKIKTGGNNVVKRT